MSRYNRERPPVRSDRDRDRDRWRDDENRQDNYRDYGRREDEERGYVQRPGDEVPSWFGEEDAERRRRMDDMNRQREGRWQTIPGRNYGRGGGSEDWRHLDNYWNDTYGERYPGRGEFSGWEQGRENFGGNYGGFAGGYSAAGYNEGMRNRESTQGNQGHQEMTARGNFTGRGPRNYKRSDERIQEDINEQLTRHPEIDATDIEVTVKDGEVTLRGHVDNRQTKRSVEDLAEAVSGVKDVRNEIRVQQQGQQQQQQRGGKKENAA